MVLLAFSFLGFLKTLLMTVFVLSSLLLMLVVLLQEPKGGGLSSAFGGAGAETFGVQTGSVNKFTAYIAGIFMLSAIAYASFKPDEGSSVVHQNRPGASAPSDEGGTPAGGGNAPGDDGGGDNGGADK